MIAAKMLLAFSLIFGVLGIREKSVKTALEEDDSKGSENNSLESHGHFEIDSKKEQIYNGESEVNLTFKAFGREFSVALRPEKDVLSEGGLVKVHGGEEGAAPRSLPVGTTHYGGHLEGRPESAVLGRFSRGVFDGVIFTEEGDFVVEPSDRYRPRHPDYNAVVYRNGEVPWPRRQDDGNTSWTMITATRGRMTGRSLEEIHNSSDGQAPSHLCDVRVLVDSAGGAVSDHAARAAVAAASHLMAEADAIFRGVDWDGDGRANDLGFRISAMDVFEAPAAGNKTAAAAAAMSSFGRGYCVGLALVRRVPPGDAAAIPHDGAAGRACSFPGNVAVIPLLLPNGRPRPYRAAAALVAHRLGHLFGSQHDAAPPCLAAAARERFLMSPGPLQGLTAANGRFSECSRRGVGRFLQRLLATDDGRRCLRQGVSTNPPSENKELQEISEDKEDDDEDRQQQQQQKQPDLVNQVPDGWSEQQMARGSKMAKRKKDKGGAKKTPKPGVVPKTTNATTLARGANVTKSATGDAAATSRMAGGAMGANLISFALVGVLGR